MLNSDKTLFWSVGMLEDPSSDCFKTSKNYDKLRDFRFHIEIPKSEAAAYLVSYDSLSCDVTVKAYSIEDAYFIVDAIFLSSPFDVHPIPFK